MTVTPNTGPKLGAPEALAEVFDISSGSQIASFPNMPVGTCLGEFCPEQTASIGETEGVAAILATVEKCENCVGCVLQNTVELETTNAS